MSSGRYALLLAGVAVLCWAGAVALPRWREAALVTGLFFLFLAGGVLNWDRRGGH